MRKPALPLAPLLAVAGCLGGPAGAPAPNAGTPTGTTPTTNTPTATPAGTTETTAAPTTAPAETTHPRPADFAVGRAKRHALDAEADRLRAKLRNRSDLRDWGLGCCTADEEATVVGWNASGYFVRVQYPYWYTTGSSEADLVAEAAYFVGADERTVRGAHPQTANATVGTLTTTAADS